MTLFTTVTFAAVPLFPALLMPINVPVEPDVLGMLKMRLRETVVVRASPNCIPVTATEVFKSRIVFCVMVLVPWLAKLIPVRAVARAADSKIVFPLMVQLSLPADGVIVIPLPVKLLNWLLETVLFLFGIAAEVL